MDKKVLLEKQVGKEEATKDFLISDEATREAEIYQRESFDCNNLYKEL